jgi:glycosyltransferase involved in cell wall biosynthesis
VTKTTPYPRISVVIPTHNEAPNLEHVLPHVPTYVDEVVLVDGHSTDGTIAVASQLMPTIRFIEQTDYGKGDALRLGFEHCTGDIIVMIDADGSTDPREMDRFIELLVAGNDFVKGSRFLPAGGGSDDITPLRSLGNHVLCDLVNVLFRTQFTDLCYGYMAFWRRCLDDLQIDCTGFQVEALINLRMLKAGAKIAEVPSFEHRRIHGQSNLRTFRDGWLVLWTIMHERIRHKRVPVPKREFAPLLSAVQANAAPKED